MGLQKINYLSSDVPFYEEKANSSMCKETKAYKTCEYVLKELYQKSNFFGDYMCIIHLQHRCMVTN